MLAVLMGRSLGDTGFGQYTLVMTWLLSLLSLSEFGLSTVLTRDLAIAPNQTAPYLLNSLSAKAILAVPALLTLTLFANQLATNHNPEIALALRAGLLFLLGGLIFSSFTAVFKAHQHMLPILWATISGQIALLAGTAFLLWQHRSLAALILWAGLIQWLQVGLAFAFYRRLNIGTTEPQPISKSFTKRLIIKAWPFALAGMLAVFHGRANSLILAYLQGDQALGWYSAASRFVDVGRQLPGAFYAAILPMLAAISLQKRTLILKQARRWLFIYAAIAFASAMILAHPLIVWTYGETFAPAAFVLKILALSLVPATQNNLFVVYLYARGDEKFVNLLIFVGIVLNISLCLVFIPTWGEAGPAMALLLAESILFLAYLRRVVTNR